MAYRIPSKQFSIEQTIKKSRFIATGTHIDSAVGAKVFHEAIQTVYKTATHHCFAFVAGPAGSQISNGISDDGEPKGTAGYPMLNILLHSGIGEIAVVVTRYYGGVRLGTGGLARAYSGMVKELVAVMPLKTKITGVVIEMKLAYNRVSLVKTTVASFGGEILTEQYTDCVQMTVRVPEAEETLFKSRLPFDVTFITPK